MSSGLFHLLRRIFRQPAPPQQPEQTAGTLPHHAFPESAQQYRSLINNIHTAVVVHGPDTQILSSNPMAQQLLGLTEAQMLNKKAIDPAWHFFLDNGSPLPLDDYPVNQVLASRKPLRNMVVGVHNPQREKDAWALVDADPVFDKRGEIAQIIVTLTDITERKQAEQERLAHLHFLDSLDRVNRIITGATDLEQMMSDVLDELLAIFDCDRSGLAYPCDPDSPTWQIMMERARPGYETDKWRGELPMTDVRAEAMRLELASSGPLQVGPKGDHPLASVTTAKFSILSYMSMVLYPKTGAPWEFAIHQCTHVRSWNSHEVRLFDEIGRRLADGLSSLLVLRDLRKSEEKYRRLFDTASEGIWEQDENFNTSYSNEHMAEMMGYSVEELENRPVTDFMFKEDIPDHIARTENRKRGKSEIYERRFIRKDGSTLWTLLSATPVFDGDQFKGSYAMFTDITERKNAEMKVQESEQLFRALVENSPDFIARYDLDCRRIYVNPAIQKLFPAPQEVVLGETPEQQSPIKTPQFYIEHLQKVIKTGDESFLETPFRTAQGEMHWGQIRFTPEFDPNGKVTSVLAIGRDIHEIKESEQRSSRFIANLPAFFFTFRRTEDGRYCFPYASTGIKTLYGLNPEDVREDMTPLHLLAHPDDRPRIEADLAEAFETLEPFRLEYRVCPPNMPQRWLETRSVANKEADGSILWYGIMLDITERKQAEEEQRRLNRELRAISTCNQALIRAEDEQMLLNDVCNTICDDAGYVLAWVGYAEQDAEKSIRPMAWAGNDSGYIANAKLSWSEDLPHGQGPAGIAIRSGKPYYVQDFSEDEHMFPWRSAALQRGYRSGIALPLKDENAAVFGVLLIYSTEINVITPDELRLMEELADDLAFGVVALRNRAERKQAEQQLILLNFALNNINEEAILVDEQARITYVNDEACRGLKYSHEELLTMTIPDIDPLFSLEKWPETWTNIQERGSLTFEGLHLVSDHSEYPVEVSASYFDYENRGYILALSRDITERKHTEQEMLRMNRFLRTLSRCNETLVHTQDEQSLLQEMCRVVVEVGEFALAWVGFSDDSQTLRIQAQFGGVVEGYVDRSTLIDGTAADQTSRPAIRALQSGEIEVVQNSATDPCLPWRNQALEFGYKSAIALPLHNGDKVFGVFAIYSSEADSFGSAETALLSELASDPSYGIQALRTRIDREHFVSQLQESIESTIQALASTVDLRDPYTAGHQRRVANLAAAIARAAGFTEDRVQVIFLAGLVHDIGKIAIPAEILSKPGRLSETEMSLARTHVTASYDILKNIDFPWPIARIVRQHHERMDGSGYPDGLKGNEILQETRILMVADVVEAMNTHRPYRPAHSIDEALEELQNGRGTVYDTDIVDLCIKLFREDGYLLE